MCFRDLLEELDEEDQVKRVKEEISTEFEIAGKLRDSDKVLLFENVEGHDMRVVGNIYGTRERIVDALGIKKNKLIDKIRKSLSNPSNPTIISDGPIKGHQEENVDLEKLPILRHFEKDGGPYVTSSIVVAKNSEGKRNISFHRLQQIDRDKFAIRLVPRDLHRMYKEAEERGEPLEIAAVLGNGPVISIAAATSPPYEFDEFELASALAGKTELKLVECKTVDLEVPARSEMVLEGEILPGERAPEGPFADITGTYDAVRKQPVFQVNHIMRRKDSIYQAILPGGPEHQYLMGIPREPLIYEEVDKVTEVKNVTLSPGGCGWLHAFVSIDKQSTEDGKKAIRAAFEGHSSLKHVVVVDDDIDIYNSESIEWAIATRSRADRDVIIESDVVGSSLDPTADPETRLGSKMGIDATKNLEDTERFERAKIPGSDSEV